MPNSLFVGTNYHPHDWDEKRWMKDIELMKQAHFNVVRLGHLCWDSFQPSEDSFTFEWFDHVMDLFYNAGIQVVLDIPTRPAPIWLHKKYPEIDICDRNGIRQKATTRYMEDVGDPNFQKYALALAEKMVSRYGHHKALLAFGLCNEIGAGFISYSPSAEKRFRKWLERKYETVETLNKAWAGQRWSRKVNSFDDVELPICGIAEGAPERTLDMRRFYSDELGEYLVKLNRVVKSFDENIITSSNHWAENPNCGFDYYKYCREFVDVPGVGFYPGINPEDRRGLLGACMISDHRIGEMDRPMWDLEFQTGTFGGYSCPEKAMRMYAYLSLLCRSQMICGWTWRSMLGGEEQYFFGLLDHDGTPSKKYTEFKQIGEEFEKISKYNLFPRKTAPEIAIAYSFESQLVSNYSKDYYKTNFNDQFMEIYTSLFEKNLDFNIVNLRHIALKYRVLIIPQITLMDKESAETIREFVHEGGTAIMTAYSAKADEHNQVFDTPFPGLVNNVFGIRVGGFDRSFTHVAIVNEGGLDKKPISIQRTKIGVDFKNVSHTVDYHEFLEMETAESLCDFTGTKEKLPAITVNHYGKGKAYYVAVPANLELFNSLLNDICEDLKIKNIPYSQKGVAAREVGEKIYLFVNTDQDEKIIPFTTSARSLINDKIYSGEMKLDGFDVELVQVYE